MSKRFDYSAFLISGKKTEDLFSDLFLHTEEATKEQNIKEHWDVLVSAKIDVKGLKKSSRSGEVNENIHWIEIKNVAGNHGWLYSDEVEYFAFETIDYFIIVKKEDLQDLIKEKVEKTFVKSSSDALYKLYRREGRKDVITLIKTIDLVYICLQIIKKK